VLEGEDEDRGSPKKAKLLEVMARFHLPINWPAFDPILVQFHLPNIGPAHFKTKWASALFGQDGAGLPIRGPVR